jgi:hypothetical protein
MQGSPRRIHCIDKIIAQRKRWLESQEEKR